ncbi:YPL014W [Saccharomyces arboricola H-6]|uniref:YPL014W n=1 Tax=Saccharomyces arboricola (strain H-6 / AS 2.3317 / CBS 10644) TaxID=1160507 RepID=J8PVB1_SACAR|nr:YPL014W [Saccharomyces arboricola H-6]
MLLKRLHKRLHAGSSRRSHEDSKDTSGTTDDVSPVQPEPQLQTQEPQPLLECDYDDMIAFDRNFSTPVFTPVMTPINNSSSNQTKNSENSYFPPYLNINRTRQNSASSLASSVSDFPQSFKQHAIYNSNPQVASFTPQFVGLLLEVYQNTCGDPTITPFDTTNPPSGILNRVAKVAIHQSELQQLDIGCDRNSWLLTLVRHRLLQEVRKDGYLSRNTSLTSLPPPPPPQFSEMLGAPSPFTNADIADPIPLSNTISNQNLNLNGNVANTLNWYSLQRSNTAMKNRNGSSQYISELQPQPILARTNSNSSTNNGNVFSLLTPTPTTDSAFNFNIALLSRQRSNIMSSPLASTRLPTANVTAEDSSVLPNDSLKLKRDLLCLER